MNVLSPRQPLLLSSLAENIKTVYTSISRPSSPYIYGQSDTNNIVATPLNTTTLDGNIRNRMRININTKMSLFHGQNNTCYCWNTARRSTLDGNVRAVIY